MFIDRYLELCEINGVAPTRVLVDLGMSKSTITNWRGGSEPSNPTKKKIADYFGITVRELMEGQKETAPPESGADDELTDILEDARRRPELRVLFSMSRKATPEEVRQTIKIIQALGDNDGDDYN